MKKVCVFVLLIAGCWTFCSVGVFAVSGNQTGIWGLASEWFSPKEAYTLTCGQQCQYSMESLHNLCDSMCSSTYDTSTKKDACKVGCDFYRTQLNNCSGRAPYNQYQSCPVQQCWYTYNMIWEDCVKSSGCYGKYKGNNDKLSACNAACSFGHNRMGTNCDNLVIH